MGSQADKLVLPPFVRSASVYFSSDQIVIVALNRDLRGMFPPGPPIFQLGRHTSAIEAGNALTTSLHGSRDGLTENEFVENLNNFLSMMRVPPHPEVLERWTLVERRWDLIMVSFNPDNSKVIFNPMKRYGRAGYVHTGQTLEVDSSPEAAGIELLRLINGKEIRQRGVPTTSKDSDRERTSNAANRARTPALEKISEFTVGDRVTNVFGDQGTVIDVNPGAEHGLGVIRIQFDDGRMLSFTLVASGLTIVTR